MYYAQILQVLKQRETSHAHVKAARACLETLLLRRRDRHRGQKRCLALVGCNGPMTERRVHLSRTIRPAASQPARFVHAHALRWSEPATYHKAALCSICDAAVFVPLHLSSLGLPPAPNARTGLGCIKINGAQEDMLASYLLGGHAQKSVTEMGLGRCAHALVQPVGGA